MDCETIFPDLKIDLSFFEKSKKNLSLFLSRVLPITMNVPKDIEDLAQERAWMYIRRTKEFNDIIKQIVFERFCEIFVDAHNGSNSSDPLIDIENFYEAHFFEGLLSTEIVKVFATYREQKREFDLKFYREFLSKMDPEMVATTLGCATENELSPDVLKEMRTRLQETTNQKVQRQQEKKSCVEAHLVSDDITDLSPKFWKWLPTATIQDIRKISSKESLWEPFYCLRAQIKNIVDVHFRLNQSTEIFIKNRVNFGFLSLHWYDEGVTHVELKYHAPNYQAKVFYPTSLISRASKGGTCFLSPSDKAGVSDYIIINRWSGKKDEPLEVLLVKGSRTPEEWQELPNNLIQQFYFTFISKV